MRIFLICLTMLTCMAPGFAMEKGNQQPEQEQQKAGTADPKGTQESQATGDPNILKLQPISFVYKEDKGGCSTYGIISTEDEDNDWIDAMMRKGMAEALIRSIEENKVETITYTALPLLLLAELAKAEKDEFLRKKLEEMINESKKQ